MAELLASNIFPVAKRQRASTLFEQLNTKFKRDVLRQRRHLAADPRFNAFIMVVIFLNTIAIGVEVDYASGTLQDRAGFFLLEVIFILVFFGEMVLRLHQLKWDYFLDAWNLFDYCLVVLSLADVILLIVKNNPETIRLASTLRILRLFRVVRSIQGVKALEGLWLIITGLFGTMLTVLWLACLLIVMVYCFGVALCTTAGQQENADWPDMLIYVGSVGRSMLTIVQVITLDSWAADIARPLMVVSPSALAILIFSIIVITFGTLNILVAVMVERVQSISRGNDEKNQKVLERTEKALLESISRDLLKHAANCRSERNDNVEDEDKQDVGQMDFQAYKKIIKTESFSYKLKLLGVDLEEAEAMFEIMDADRSGTVDAAEFISGLKKVKGLAKGKDVCQLIGFAQRQCLRASRFSDRLRMLNEKADCVQERLNYVGRGLVDELHHREEMAVRDQETKTEAAKRTLVCTKVDQDRRNYFPGLSNESGEQEDMVGMPEESMPLGRRD